MKYAFLLGKNANMSIAELGCFFSDLKFAKEKKLAFVVQALPAEPQIFLNRLGGSLAIVEIFAENLGASGVQPAIENYLKNVCTAQTGKCNFALNILPERKKSRVLQMLLPAIKKNLRDAGLRPNFMNNNFENVNDVFAVKQGLVAKKTWIAIIDQGEGRTALGFYTAAQDFEGYSKRDYGKPFRDVQAGMLPPKVAQMMVNFACHSCHSEFISEIYDPFCGTGTILMEALLAGHSVVGSDSSEKMIAGAQKNVEWLRQNFPVPDGAQIKIFQKSATEITLSDLPPSTLSIVTEPLLGPSLSSFPAPQFLEKVIAELEKLYLDFFANLSRIAPPRLAGPVVVIFPYWIDKKSGEKVMLSARIIDKIERFGYIKTNFVPLKTDSLFYDRPDQIVGREIVRLVKNIPE